MKKKRKPRETKYLHHQRPTLGDEILNSSPNIKIWVFSNNFLSSLVKNKSAFSIFLRCAHA